MQPKTEPTPEPSASTEAAAPIGPPVNYLTILVLPETHNSGYPSPALAPLDNPGSQPPRPMRAIDPTVTFSSRTMLNAYANVRVIRDGHPLFAEKTALRYLESRTQHAPVYPAQMEMTHLYSTEVVPGFWSHLCECGSEYLCAVWAVERQELTYSRGFRSYPLHDHPGHRASAGWCRHRICSVSIGSCARGRGALHSLPLQDALHRLSPPLAVDVKCRCTELLTRVERESATSI